MAIFSDDAEKKEIREKSVLKRSHNLSKEELSSETSYEQSIRPKTFDTYIGQKISFSGYIYRINDFSDDRFVLARDMDIGNNQTLIVGFLCSYNNVSEFDSYSWVEIEGEIAKGKYNGQEIPIINVYKLEKANKPENSTVPLPDDAYVPTAVIY